MAQIPSDVRANLAGMIKDSNSGRVAQAFEAAGSKNKWRAPSFAFGAKDGNHEPLPDGFVAALHE